MKKIKLSSSILMLLLLSLFSGFIIKVMILLTIVFLHEIGHIISCLRYNRKIDKIYILPFGAFMKYEEDSNTFLKEEMIIAASGIFVNLGIFIVCKVFKFPDYIIALNNYVLFFNLLTIYPLDGGRVLEIFLCKIFRFKVAVFITLVISFLTIIILIVVNVAFLNSLNLFFMLILLLIENIKYFKNKSMRFNRFLLKKYLNKNEDLKNKKIQPIGFNILGTFFKGCNNCLFENKKIVKKEEEILNQFYQK